VSGVDWTSLVLAILLVELTPGPNMAWLAALSLSQGRRAGMAAVVGIALGLFVNALAAGLGAAALISAVPALWEALRWAGVAFMLWLAWDAWRSADPATLARAAAGTSTQRHFVAGMTVNLLNPKALLFFLLLIPQFVRVEDPPMGLVAAIALISVGIATAVHLAIIMVGGAVARWFVAPARGQVVRRVLALSLVGVAIWFAVGARMPTG
jgi:threonine/homoserine/homoserine lactone efflux protein